RDDDVRLECGDDAVVRVVLQALAILDSDRLAQHHQRVDVEVPLPRAATHRGRGEGEVVGAGGGFEGGEGHAGVAGGHGGVGGGVVPWTRVESVAGLFWQLGRTG